MQADAKINLSPFSLSPFSPTPEVARFVDEL